ncbi:MAG: DNA-protecting protein DprA [Saprospiraceae bacterium]|nr:DNA-protecting protein DprA [Saprospiraceae bacterium]
MEEKLYQIALHQADMVGPVIAKSLVAYCGEASKIFSTPINKLRKIPNIGELTAHAIKNFNAWDRVEKELKFIEDHQIKLLFYTDPEYPSRLRNINDSPLLLYYKGNADLNAIRTVGIVGTRMVTEYGKLLTENLVSFLSDFQVCVLSGLAYGVDTVAHKSSVGLNIPTIGILGHGLDRIYPSQNTSLAKKMCEHGGLLTEFNINTRPDKQNFPMRNRIVAGMSDAVVVVETKKEGGSLITAQLANDYNKDVFAFPGRIDDEFSAGCHSLIKDHKAHLIESGADLVALMNWDRSEDLNLSTNQPLLFHDLSSDEQNLLETLKTKQKVHIDLLHQTLTFTPGTLAGLLLGLQLKGLIKEMPGKMYSLSS